MENEETESRALVPIEEVEADLIFSPALGGSQITGYGSRKIIRQSIIDQLKPGYPIFQCECEEVTNEIVTSRCKKSTEWVLNVLKVCGVCTRQEIASKTGLSITAVRYLLYELNEAGLIDVSVYRGTYHYRIHE